MKDIETENIQNQQPDPQRPLNINPLQNQNTFSVDEDENKSYTTPSIQGSRESLVGQQGKSQVEKEMEEEEEQLQ